MSDQPKNARDPFRKVLDYVEEGDARSLVDAVNIIVGARAEDGARAVMIVAAVRIYQGEDDDE